MELMEGSPLGVLQAIYRYARFPNTHIWKYGLTMRDILDNHGNAIRNTNDNAKPNNLEKELGEQPCQCCILFPDFIDPTVSHVRTNNTEILGTVLGPLASKGLNFRPVLQISVRELQSHVRDWVSQVMSALEKDLDIATCDSWLSYEGIREEPSQGSLLIEGFALKGRCVSHFVC